ncbi:unnamed protein product [Rhizoctonia solani]|nr:unnamed protein product [Rhizoctonia solani]
MFAPLHPLWGRLIETLDSAPDIIRLTVSAEEEISGQKALQKVCHQAVDATILAQEPGRDVDIAVLDSALRLAQDPRTIRYLAHPSVISGCIRLLKTAVSQRGRSSSPFRYEYGHLCFKLLVASMNICLLERYNELDEALLACEEHDEYAADYLASVALGLVVENRFQISYNGSNSNWVSGWATSDAQQAPLVSRSDLSTLLGLLWDDRKFILATSGLSGLLFLLSQYIFQEKNFNDSLDGEVLKGRMYELGLRYLLVAEQSQRAATLRAIDANHPEEDNWSVTPKHIDAEDSRLLMTAFIKRLSNGNDLSVFLTREPSVMLRLITTSTDPDTQDLLPGVIRCAVEYGWSMLFGIDLDLEHRLQGIARTLFGVLV